MTKKQLEEFYKFMGATSQSLCHVVKEITDIKTNHLHHLNKKVDNLMYTVLGSVICGILAIAYRIFFM